MCGVRFVFEAEDGIRDLVRSRGLGDVYKRQVRGPLPAMAGFYSYGEVAPLRPQTRSELHNQTMTVTVFIED